jgi:hypothetical protein
MGLSRTCIAAREAVSECGQREKFQRRSSTLRRTRRIRDSRISPRHGLSLQIKCNCCKTGTISAAGAGSPRSENRFGMRRTFDHHLSQRGIEGVFRVRAIEPVISVAAAQDELGRMKLRQFVLDRLKRKEAQTRQLSHIQFLPWIGKQEAKNLRSHQWKQRV